MDMKDDALTLEPPSLGLHYSQEKQLFSGSCPTPNPNYTVFQQSKARPEGGLTQWATSLVREADGKAQTSGSQPSK